MNARFTDNGNGIINANSAIPSITNIKNMIYH
jgi:hypothetical protein